MLKRILTSSETPTSRLVRTMRSVAKVGQGGAWEKVREQQMIERAKVALSQRRLLLIEHRLTEPFP